MTYSEAKERLHSYIDHADERRVMDMLSIMEDDKENSNVVYDQHTLNMLRERSREISSGTAITYPVKESMERLRAQIRKNGL